MYGALAPLIGALVTIMSGINSRFSEIAGPVVAVLVIHATGLIAILGISLVRRTKVRRTKVRRDKVRRTKVPLWHYLGGLVGVATVFSSNYAFSALGASLTMAVALLGQTIFSVVTDATGMLGRTRYPLSARRLPGIALALAGVAVMGGDWRLAGPALLVAFGAGVTSGLSTVLNAGLGTRKGVLHSVRANYAVGLTTTAAIAVIIRPSLPDATTAIVAAGPLLALGGGLMGIVVVSTINVIVPRLSVFMFSILMFAGQTVTGIIMDALGSGAIDMLKIAGTVILLCGLALDTLLSGHAQRNPAAMAQKP
jgi:transporter family-2 protein